MPATPSVDAAGIAGASYPLLVHRLAVSLHASSPHPVSLMQLRFASFAVINLRWDLHPLGRAHAGRTVKKAADIAAARNTHVAQGAPTFVPSYTSAFLTQSGISSEYVREDAALHRPWAYRPSPNADQSGFA